MLARFQCCKPRTYARAACLRKILYMGSGPNALWGCTGLLQQGRRHVPAPRAQAAKQKERGMTRAR